MAKKQTGPAVPEPTPGRVVIIHLKGTTAYAAWLDHLAAETHIAKATLFRVAMAEYAQNHGHASPPPK